MMLAALRARALMLAAALLALVLPSAARSDDAVDLRDVRALTFRRGKMTAARRVAAVPQVRTQTQTFSRTHREKMPTPLLCVYSYEWFSDARKHRAAGVCQRRRVQHAFG